MCEAVPTRRDLITSVCGCRVRSSNNVHFVARRCQCLGEMQGKDLARQALDMFCRNVSYAIGNTGVRDAFTREDIIQIVPNKTRCGSNDPIDMQDHTQCKCLSKEGKGAKEGIWINLEILNLPWGEELADFESDEFKEAKYLTEKAVSTSVEKKSAVSWNFSSPPSDG